MTRKIATDWLDQLDPKHITERAIYKRLLDDHAGVADHSASSVALLAKSIYEEMLARDRLLTELQNKTPRPDRVRMWQTLYDSARSQSNKLRLIIERGGAESGRRLSKKERLANEAASIGNSNSVYAVPATNKVVSISAGRKRK